MQSLLRPKTRLLFKRRKVSSVPFSPLQRMGCGKTMQETCASKMEWKWQMSPKTSVWQKRSSQPDSTKDKFRYCKSFGIAIINCEDVETEFCVAQKLETSMWRCPKPACKIIQHEPCPNYHQFSEHESTSLPTTYYLQSSTIYIVNLVEPTNQIQLENTATQWPLFPAV